MDDLDRAIVNRLQGGFPVCDRPFQRVARSLGTDEATLLRRLGALLEDGTLTRFGPMFDVEKMGGTFLLCALRVPRSRFDEIAALVNAHPEVAHNYEREHAWNMWFVLAAATPEAVADAVRRIAAETGLAVLELPRFEEYFVELRLTA
jgi:DNA-binding Lrp family transcriptional regulator